MILETTLLITITAIKVLAIISMAIYLYESWHNQSVRFKSDFPYLMAITFFIYGSMKILDIYLYIYIINYGTPTTGFGLIVGRYLRFIFSPVLSMGILTYILMKIWFPEKRKLQFTIGALWITGALLTLLLIKELSQFYIAIGIFTAPILMFTIITFGLTYKLKKLPNINSLFLSIGYSILMISQLLRNVWRQMGNGPFGYSWIGELVELFSLMIIGYGFSHPAKYNKKMKTSQYETLESKVDFGQARLIDDSESEMEPINEDWEQLDIFS